MIIMTEFPHLNKGFQWNCFSHILYKSKGLKVDDNEMSSFSCQIIYRNAQGTYLVDTQ